MGEFDAVNVASWTDNVADMARCRPACRAEVQNLRPVLERDVGQSFDYCCCQLASVRVPDSIFVTFDFVNGLSVDAGPWSGAEGGQAPFSRQSVYPVDSFELLVRLDQGTGHDHVWAAVLDNGLLGP